MSAAGFSWTLPPTLHPVTQSTTVCHSSVMVMCWPSTACCGTTRRGLGSTSPVTGQGQPIIVCNLKWEICSNKMLTWDIIFEIIPETTRQLAGDLLTRWPPSLPTLDPRSTSLWPTLTGLVSTWPAPNLRSSWPGTVINLQCLLYLYLFMKCCTSQTLKLSWREKSKLQGRHK